MQWSQGDEIFILTLGTGVELRFFVLFCFVVAKQSQEVYFLVVMLDNRCVKVIRFDHWVYNNIKHIKSFVPAMGFSVVEICSNLCVS